MEEATASNRISLVRFQPNDLKRGVTARLPSAPLIVYNGSAMRSAGLRGTHYQTTQSLRARQDA